MKSLVATVDLSRTEILAQDDASPEYDATQVLGLPVKVERNPFNLGFGANCNVSALRAKGEFILFLNQDCVAQTPGWLDIMIHVLQTTNAGIVGPKLVFPGGGIQSAGGWFDAAKGPFHRYIGWTAIDDWRVNTTEPVSWLTGAGLMLRRSDFEQLGGFDQDYRRGYFEDVDLCQRVKHELGKEVWYCAEAVLIHTVGSAGGVPAEVFRANSARFHQKWDAVIEPDVPSLHVDY